MGAPTYTYSWTRVEIRMPHGMGSAGHTGLPVVCCPQAPETGTQAAQALVPNHALHSRFLVLVALQAAHLPLVHLGHVYVSVDHKLILANAEKERRRVRLGAGRGEGGGELSQGVKLSGDSA